MTAFLPILTVASENKSYLHCNAYLSRVGLHYFHEWKSFLKTKSLRRSYKKNRSCYKQYDQYIQGVSKYLWFFNPKNANINSGIDQNKKSPSFWHIGQKMLIWHENLEFLMARENFSLKKGNFYQWVKWMAIFVLINARANGNIFRVKKLHISLRSVYFRHPVELYSSIYNFD